MHEIGRKINHSLLGSFLNMWGLKVMRASGHYPELLSTFGCLWRNGLDLVLRGYLSKTEIIYFLRILILVAWASFISRANRSNCPVNDSRRTKFLFIFFKWFSLFWMRLAFASGLSSIYHAYLDIFWHNPSTLYVLTLSPFLYLFVGVTKGSPTLLELFLRPFTR